MTAEVDAAPLSDGQVVDRDQHCVNCGYNLRTLATAGQCPECGMRVAHSLHGDELGYSNPGWVGALHFGFRLLNWLLPLGAVAGIIGWQAGINSILLALILMLLISTQYIWAVWKITTPEPRSTVSPRENRFRKFLRFYPAGVLAVLLVSLLIPVLSPSILGPVIMFVILLLFCAPIPSLWALLYYVRRLALRLPNLHLAEIAGRLMWRLTMCLIMNVIGIFIISYYDELLATFSGTGTPAAGTPPSPLAKPLIYFMLIALLVNFYYGIAFFFLMYRLRQTVGEAARHAARNISAASADGRP